jgi:hypothetical protein
MKHANVGILSSQGVAVLLVLVFAPGGRASLVEASAAAPGQQTPPGTLPLKAPAMMPGTPPPAVTGRRAEIDMQIDVGIPTVFVTVNGRGPYRFGVDTGAQGFARVSTRVIRDLALVQVGEMITGDPSGRDRRTVPVYHLDALGVDGLTYTGVTAEELVPLGHEVDGILGLGLFASLTLTLDFGRGRLVAEHSALPAADGASILDYTTGPTGFVELPIRIGELETVLTLDTGAARTGMALPPDKLKEIVTRGRPRAVGRAKTASQEIDISEVDLAVPVRFGTVTLPIASVTFPSPDPVGVIGSVALRTFAVTVDQQNRRVRIVPSATPTPNPRGTQQATAASLGSRGSRCVANAPFLMESASRPIAEAAAPHR